MHKSNLKSLSFTAIQKKRAPSYCSLNQTFEFQGRSRKEKKTVLVAKAKKKVYIFFSPLIRLMAKKELEKHEKCLQAVFSSIRIFVGMRQAMDNNNTHRLRQFPMKRKKGLRIFFSNCLTSSCMFHFEDISYFLNFFPSSPVLLPPSFDKLLWKIEKMCSIYSLTFFSSLSFFTIHVFWMGKMWTIKNPDLLIFLTVCVFN